MICPKCNAPVADNADKCFNCGEVFVDTSNDENTQVIQDKNNDTPIAGPNMDILSMSDEILNDVRETDSEKPNSFSVPIAKLSTLGTGVSSLVPVIAEVTQTVNTTGLYQLANQSVGDTLKPAKDGNFWGAFYKADGGSKFAKLKQADPTTVTNEVVMKANPATMMMAVALYSIENELGNIADMEKQILSFLEIEKESEIEADVVTLTEMINKYKHNWDNERYIASNHKMVCDIQRTARKNMIAYQKQVAEELKSNPFLVMSTMVESTLKELVKKFKYYRLSLFIFSLASLNEIMLSGNFKEENIKASIEEINKNAEIYKNLFSDCSKYLEKLSNDSVKTNLLKGAGVASNAVGKLMGVIPLVKDTKADKALIEMGESMSGDAKEISKEIVQSFEEVRESGEKGIVNKLVDMNRIYNHTKEICFDKDNLYLLVA